MKNNLKILVVLIAPFLLNGCSDSYYDVNTPDNAISPSKTELKNILGPAILLTLNANFAAAADVEEVNQHLAGNNNENSIDTHYPSGLDNVWFSIYVRALSNIKQVEIRATETNSSHYKGIAQVLKAITIGLATDLYGDVPYTEAALGGANLTPKYDSQQSIYTDIDRLFVEAIANLSAPNTSPLNPGDEDLIYGGNVSKWIKAANSFRARYQLHLTDVNGNASYTAALASLANGFTSNADDFQLKFTAERPNPWRSTQVALTTGNPASYVSKHFISYMNGTVFPFATVMMDPRLPILVDIRIYPNYLGGIPPNPLVAANYGGSTNGTGGGAGVNARIGVDKFYSKADSPLVLMSFAEAKFIEAEARYFLGGGTATSIGTNAAAYLAYQQGIDANMDKLQVAAADKSAYTTDASIDLTPASLKFQDIMRQKFIALFLNTESFNDYRRFDFSANVFKGLTLPVGADPLNGGKWITRFIYSSDERNTNEANYLANFKSMTTKVWWDK